jgi:hypothetical protein
METKTPLVDSSKITTSVISSSLVFKFIAVGEYILVSNWFKKIGASFEAYANKFSTKQAIERISKHIDSPLICHTDIVDSKSPEDDACENGKYVYVHKYMVATVLSYLDTDDLKILVGDKLPNNILLTKMSESLLIRTTDGWFSATTFATYFKKDPLVFARTPEVISIIQKFGSVIRIEINDDKDRSKKTVWCHPILLLSAMRWISEPAALELLAGYFMYSSIPLPDTDALAKLAEKHTTLS